MRVFGLGETIDHSRESIDNCKRFFQHMLLQSTLGGNFDIFAASDDSTAWVLFWKTRSRPIGVMVCLVAQLRMKEEMRPIIHLRRQTLPSLMTLTFPLGPCGPLAPLAPPGDREKVRNGNTSRERLPLRP